jgi:hypothetical protein
MPMESISVEMVFRGLYHFSVADHQGKATDLVAYLTAPENQDLGCQSPSYQEKKTSP